MNQFIVALCGIPASGKTILARVIQELLSVETDVVIVDTDTCRDEAYCSNFTPELEKKVRKEALRRTEEIVKSGRSVIHDDTNYYTSMRHELYEIAVRHGCAFGVVFVSTPLEKSLEWNSLRKKPIPEDVVKRIKERMNTPGTKYTWDSPVAIVNLSREKTIDAAKNVVESIRDLSLPNIEGSPTAESNAYNQIDSVTRRVVSEFLQEYPSYRSDPRVSRLRRELLVEARTLQLEVREVERMLRVRLGILADRTS